MSVKVESVARWLELTVIVAAAAAAAADNAHVAWPGHNFVFVFAKKQQQNEKNCKTLQQSN